jgi:Protein of unknown function (DUF2380)
MLKTTRNLILALATGTLMSFTGPASADAVTTRSVAMLGTFLQNDNEGYEPTSDAERARVTALEVQFKSALEASGQYKFVNVTPDMKAKIAAGQPIGECGGCDIDFGKAAGANTIAWVRVQKISNLIMNMNVYVADVATNKMLFIHSVDIRGNTDESWSRSMAYLLKNYMFPLPANSG